VSDADVRGKWSSSSSTRRLHLVCPTRARRHADLYDEFTSLGVEVYSVSTDTHHVHAAWHKSSDTIGKIRYFMVGDPSGTITRNFDNMRDGQGLADRGTFLVDPDGIIQYLGSPRRVSAATRRAAAQGEGRAVRAQPPGRGLPGQVGRGRDHPGPVDRSRRQDLTPHHQPRETTMLDASTTAQLKTYLEKVTQPIELVATLDDGPKSAELAALLEATAALSDKVTYRRADDDARRPSFRIERVGTDIGVRSPASPMGTSSARTSGLLQVGAIRQVSEELAETIKRSTAT
jgi:peroxiredoxin